MELLKVQEYIMTHKYSHGGHFPSSVFLVLANLGWCVDLGFAFRSKVCILG